MTALRDLLANPEQPIAFATELTYRDPDTDAVSTVRIWDNQKQRSQVPAGDLWGLLDSPGDRSVGVTLDELEAVSDVALSPIVFTNEPPAPGAAGPLDFLADMTLDGRSVKRLAGSPTEAIAEYEEVASGVADGEPEFDYQAGTVTLTLRSVLQRLGQDLDVRRYIGEPSALRTLTSTTRASTAYNAAHDLTEYTLACRVRPRVLGGTGAVTTADLIAKLASAASNNFLLRIRGNALDFRYSSGGVNAVTLAGPGVLSIGQSYDIVVARREGHVYLMQDGLVSGESTSGGAPDLPAVGLAINAAASGSVEICDVRVYDHYKSPDEAREAMASRASSASSDEPGSVGLWRGDDNLGPTLTDYSPTGADATITGTEGVNYNWASSDLGSEEIAGRSMPGSAGELFNAEADLVDPFRERWRYRDRALPTPGGSSDPTPVVRDSGELLTETSDWSDGGDGVIQLMSEGALITVGTFDTASGNEFRWAFPDAVLEELFVEYGRLTTADLNTDALARLSMIYPQRTGVAFRRSPIREVAAPYMQGLAGYLTLDPDGKIRVDVLRPPVSPGPRGGPCVEFLAEPDTGINFGDVGAVASPKSWTIAAWIRTQRTGTNTSVESITGTTIQEVIIDKTGLGAGIPGDYGFGTSGYTARGLAAWGASVKTMNKPVLRWSVPGQWQFVIVANDVTADEVRFYWAPLGGTLARVQTISGAMLVSETTEDVIIGSPHNLGSLAEVSVWDKALSSAERTVIFNDAPAGTEPNLVFYAPLNEGSGAPRDLVSGASGVMTGCAWRPNVTYDLTVTPRPFHERRLRPAKSIDVRFRRNHRPITESEAAAALTDKAKLDLQKESLSLPWENPATADDYLGARDIVVDSPMRFRAGARAVLAHLIYRFDPARRYGVLQDAGREGAALLPGDEVRVVGHGSLSAGRNYRVAANRAQWSQLTAELGLWR